MVGDKSGVCIVTDASEISAMVKPLRERKKKIASEKSNSDLKTKVRKKASENKKFRAKNKEKEASKKKNQTNKERKKASERAKKKRNSELKTRRKKRAKKSISRKNVSDGEKEIGAASIVLRPLNFFACSMAKAGSRRL